MTLAYVLRLSQFGVGGSRSLDGVFFTDSFNYGTLSICCLLLIDVRFCRSRIAFVLTKMMRVVV